MPKQSENTIATSLENLHNIYRVRKVKPNSEEDKTRVVEVHTIDLNRQLTVASACEFENGWHVLGYVSSLSDKTKVWKLISEFESKTLKRIKKERDEYGKFTKTQKESSVVAKINE